MNIRLGHLKTGDYRKLTPQELSELSEMIRRSSNAPVLHDKTRNDYSVTYTKPKKDGEEKAVRENERRSSPKKIQNRGMGNRMV